MKKHYKFQWFGLAVLCTSSSSIFLTQLQNRFKGFVAKKTEKLFSASILFSFVETGPNQTVFTDAIQYGTRFYCTDSTIIVRHSYLLTHTTIVFTVVQKQVKKIAVFYQSHFLFKAVNVLLRGSLEKQLFTILIQEYLEKTLLFLAGVTKNIGYFHAATVEKNGKAIVFTGLNGVGKSSIVQFLILNKQYQQMSDNYVLVKGTSVFLYPDIPRLSQKTFELLKSSVPQNNAEFGKVNLSLDKIVFSKNKKATLTQIYIVSRAHRASTQKMTFKAAMEKVATLVSIDHEDVISHPLRLFFSYPTTAFVSDKIPCVDFQMKDLSDVEKVGSL